MVTSSALVTSNEHTRRIGQESRLNRFARSAGSETRSVAIVGTYPPTKCGIATFTSNVRSAIASAQPDWDVRVLRVADPDEAHALNDDVVGVWSRGDARSLRDAIDTLNDFDCVVLQHEFGIFPGPDGSDVLELVEGIEVPVVVIFHTALKEPTIGQREVIDGLMSLAQGAIVQSAAARDVIAGAHPGNRIDVIAHGATANFDGPRIVELDAPTILTWGLIGPGKGIESGIRALARLTPAWPDARYLVAGQTHPKERLTHGERYRDSLMSLANRLGVGDRVEFDDGYRDFPTLRALVRAATVILLPYDTTEQTSSGVLVEAIASAKPVVSTKFPHAVELLSSGAGIIVEHGDTEAMAEALDVAITDAVGDQAMSRRARAVARQLLWPAVGAAYCDVVDRVSSTLVRS